MVISALTFTRLLEMLKNPSAKYAVVALVCIGLLLPAKWCVANYPNEIVYFNEFTGGIDGAYGYYETDYYMNSLKQASYQLAQKEDLYHTKDSVLIVTNCIEPVTHYMKTVNPKIIVDYARYRERYDKKWKYAIFFSRTVDKDLLQNGHFPPANGIVTIKADHTPLCTVIKRDTAMYEHQAYQFLNAKDYYNAAVNYQKALSLNPKNETAYCNYAIALANINQLDAAIQALEQGLKFTPSNEQMWDILSKLYNAKGDKAKAQEAYNNAQTIIMREQGE
jgi:predicted Zn-dependent protease